MTGTSKYSPEELRILLLRYLEGSLTEDEKREVSGLLRESAQAQMELESLQTIVRELKTDKRIFCPDLVDIAEFVNTGKDPTGEMAEHLGECLSCREEALLFKGFRPADTIPPEIWSRVRTKFKERAPLAPPPTEDRSKGFTAWLSSLFRMPILAGASAIAIVLLLILFLYPWQEPRTMLALSSVSWDTDLTTKVPFPHADRERAAFVILLRDFAPPLSQNRIDSLYEALVPDEQQTTRYDLASPSQIKAAIEGLEPNEGSLEKAGRILSNKLGVRRIVVLTLIAEHNRIKIKAQSKDASSGKPKGQTVETLSSNDTLTPTLRKLGYLELKQGREQKDPK